MYGIDISHWQKDIDLTKTNVDFVICKLTEGDSLLDSAATKFIHQLTKLNKLIGVYHYARPDLNDYVSGAKREVQWFIANMKKLNILGTVLPFLDWEARGEVFEVRWLKFFLNYFYKETRISPGIYFSASVMNMYPDLSQEYNLWVANWTGNTQTPKKMPKNFSIWQYCNKGKILGYDGAVDLDYTEWTVRDWLLNCRPDSEVKENDTILSDILDELIKIRILLEEK